TRANSLALVHIPTRQATPPKGQRTSRDLRVRNQNQSPNHERQSPECDDRIRLLTGQCDVYYRCSPRALANLSTAALSFLRVSSEILPEPRMAFSTSGCSARI